jgi:hypothetical protein
VRTDRNGRTAAAVVNRRIGLGYALKYPAAAMPRLCEWKMMGAGTYVVGTEPGNVYPEARETLRREGRLPTLKGGESKRYELEFAVLGSLEEIDQVDREIQAMRTPIEEPPRG